MGVSTHRTPEERASISVGQRFESGSATNLTHSPTSTTRYGCLLTHSLGSARFIQISRHITRARSDYSIHKRPSDYENVPRELRPRFSYSLRPFRLPRSPLLEQYEPRVNSAFLRSPGCINLFLRVGTSRNRRIAPIWMGPQTVPRMRSQVAIRDVDD